MQWQARGIDVFAPMLIVASMTPCWAGNYPIVDTGQQRCFDNRFEIECPKPGEPFFGQDAQYQGNQAAYRDNGDGTISDLVTGLMWQKDPGSKKTYDEAVAGAAACRLGGYDDWRLPTIKELYSLILFSGEDVDPRATSTSGLKPFIDTRFFRFSYGDTANGERIIDSQMLSSTKYVSTTMGGNETVFGVNFADGRIKGYPARVDRPGGPVKRFYVFYVRGNPTYGSNEFQDNGDGTITDLATGLMWMKRDSGHLKAGDRKDGRMNWEQALRWAENLEFAGYSDWRLPNAKELQSIVDYTRSPDTTKSAAIDPIFSATPIQDTLGRVDYAHYWSSTTHKRKNDGSTACYFAFGRALGWMPSRFGRRYNLLDVHGAGAQRSDPKAGDPARFPFGRGPQGDVIGIYNMVRAVRGGGVSLREPTTETDRRSESAKESGTGRIPPFLLRFDRNHDGKVTQEEFNGAVRRFRTVDLNGDGVVSRDEAARAGPPGADPRPSRAQGPRGGQRPPAMRGRSSVPPREAEEPLSETTRPSNIRADDRWNDLPPSFVFILAVCCHQRVVGFDLFLTFCELAGIGELPDGVEGGSLASLLTNGGQGTVRRPKTDLVFHFPHYGQGLDQVPQSAIYRGNFKLMRIYETGTDYLFNIAEDIGEQQELSESMPEKAAEMQKALSVYLAEVQAQLPRENPDYVPSDSNFSRRALGRRAAAGADRQGGPRRREAPLRSRDPD